MKIVIYTQRILFSFKENEIMPFAGKWMDLEIFILSNIKSDSEKQILYVLFHYEI